MYIHLEYYSGDRMLVESMKKKGLAGVTGDRAFFLNAVDFDGDSIRYHLNDGSHFDTIFLCEDNARSVYMEILQALREDRSLIELNTRDLQLTEPGETV